MQSPTVTRNKEKLKWTQGVAVADGGAALKIIGKALTASGASAADGSLFEATLPILGRGIREWEAAKPEQFLEAQRNARMPPHAGYSWMTRLLPFVGQEALHSKFDFSKPWSDKSNRRLASRVIPAFLNPADPRTIWDGSPYRGLALSHFAGMAGVEDDRHVVAAELPRSDPRAGIFGYDRIAKAEEITDGASQTIMIVGTGQVVAPWVQGGGATIRGARQPFFDKAAGLGSKGLPKPGTCVLFADGSARVISSDIDPEIFKAMCTMHGGEAIDMSKLVTQER